MSFAPRGKGWLRGPPPGGVPPPPAYQEAHAARIARDTAPPPGATIRDLIVDVLDQGQLGSCVPNAIAQAIRCCQVRADAPDPILPARLDLYALCREDDGAALTIDSGTYVHTAVDVVRRMGFASETLRPYSDDPVYWSQATSTNNERAAFDQRDLSETSLHAIEGDDESRWLQVRQAIAGRFPVIWAGNVSRAFARNEFISYSPIGPPSPSEVDGGHCMMIASYSPDYATICNSWGTDWGTRGFFQASIPFVLSATELFVVEHCYVEGVRQ